MVSAKTMEEESSDLAPGTKVTSICDPADWLANALSSGWPVLLTTLWTAGVTDVNDSVNDGLPSVVPLISAACAIEHTSSLATGIHQIYFLVACQGHTLLVFCHAVVRLSVELPGMQGPIHRLRMD